MHLNPVIEVSNLKVHYPIRQPGWGFKKKKLTLKAVDGISLNVFPGETLGLVGESGCGKSSLGKAIIRLNQNNGGSVQINGEDFLALEGKALRKARTDIQMIFQDPYGSLDPRMTVWDILSEPLDFHYKLSQKETDQKIRDTLKLVNLNPKSLKKYPHEFSGGQRQRIAIARALVLNPKILIADEAVSALDVSIQAQILNLLRRIQKELNLAMIFISHNLAVVKYISDRIAVMYLGKIVELADAETLYNHPQHPYTKALVSAVPIPDPEQERQRHRIELVGEIPSPVNPPLGCRFHTRCPIAKAHCKSIEPQLVAISDGHQVSCLEISSPTN